MRIDFIILAVISCFVFTLSACTDSSSKSALEGLWEYQQATYRDCNDISDENVIDYSGDGDCLTINGETSCVKFELEMGASSYTLREIIDTDGSVETNVVETGSYEDVQVADMSALRFCVGSACRQEFYTLENGVLSITSFEAGTGCEIVIEAER